MDSRISSPRKIIQIKIYLFIIFLLQKFGKEAQRAFAHWRRRLERSWPGEASLQQRGRKRGLGLPLLFEPGPVLGPSPAAAEPPLPQQVSRGGLLHQGGGRRRRRRRIGRRSRPGGARPANPGSSPSGSLRRRLRSLPGAPAGGERRRRRFGSGAVDILILYRESAAEGRARWGRSTIPMSNFLLSMSHEPLPTKQQFFIVKNWEFSLSSNQPFNNFQQLYRQRSKLQVKQRAPRILIPFPPLLPSPPQVLRDVFYDAIPPWGLWDGGTSQARVTRGRGGGGAAATAAGWPGGRPLLQGEAGPVPEDLLQGRAWRAGAEGQEQPGGEAAKAQLQQAHWGEMRKALDGRGG